MRLNEERAYDEFVTTPEVIRDHLVDEFIFRNFLNNIAKKQGTINGFYWLVELVTKLYPAEFDEARATAIKKIAYKVHVAHYEEPPTQTLCVMMMHQGYKPKEVSRTLNIQPQNVYYYIRRDKEVDLPIKAMLTYGEYDVMLDFMDCWNELKKLGDL